MSSCINDCKREHKIEVEPLQDADQVEHSLLLVKGHLQPSCTSAKQLKATLTLRQQEQEQLTQLTTAGEFKLLFDLGESDTAAECELHLCCCNAQRRVQFRYQPRRSTYRVQPLLLLCEDENEQCVEDLCACIDLNLRLVQCIYAHKLSAAGFGNRTFTLNGACCVFRSQLSCATARDCVEDELWQRFASEILSSDDWGQQLHLKFVAFISCTRYDGAAVAASGDYSYANIRRHLQAHAALGGGGLALFGTGHFYAWPRHFNQIGDCIRSSRRVDVASQPDESNYRRSYGGVYASTLGAVCHELGHCFDLGHTQEGVMGHGFDYLNRVLTVDQLTEHLPQRIVTTSAAAASASTSSRPRFTQLKLKQPAGNKFLDNYHSQRRNDCFYFSRNCAVILAQHRWLCPDLKAQLHNAHIQLLPDSSEIVSNIALRLVELRCNLNSLVAHYEEFPAQPATLRFRLPDALWHLLATQRSHYVFVLTIEGDTKRLACDPVQD
ncbi:uncharacterized protein LOC133847419 [Drosophila sulfurigaster albostrigata]|uniref:uncharacterized protein LOC133847419 n=1 Tax=Drosophila sulfurigaster albostrigata TaxID=89887 RepID=UPI002D21C659|nr:uncharacterized protein LOC133847419 [Drosophila sulfurigaster albostrigata]XP_062138430.1 uncharacterized protein LOC133847419 [Drosophila sulfurigaster albostrigata]